jgi:ubiquinone biosynthesis protein UbiJ
MPFCQRGSTVGEITMTGLAMHQGAFERQFNPQAPSDLDGLAGQLGRPVTGIEPAPAPIAGEDHPAIVDPAKVVEALRETVDRLGEQVRALEARVETLAANSKEAKDA